MRRSLAFCLDTVPLGGLDTLWAEEEEPDSQGDQDQSEQDGEELKHSGILIRSGTIGNDQGSFATQIPQEGHGLSGTRSGTGTGGCLRLMAARLPSPADPRLVAA